RRRSSKRRPRITRFRAALSRRAFVLLTVWRLTRTTAQLSKPSRWGPCRRPGRAMPPRPGRAILLRPGRPPRPRRAMPPRPSTAAAGPDRHEPGRETHMKQIAFALGATLLVSGCAGGMAGNRADIPPPAFQPEVAAPVEEQPADVTEPRE